jgi:hypothetical protein
MVVHEGFHIGWEINVFAARFDLGAFGVEMLNRVAKFLDVGGCGWLLLVRLWMVPSGLVLSPEI